MNATRLLLPLAALCAADLTAQSQFDFGSLYMMSAYHAPTGGSPYPGIARVDPFNGAVTPLVQFSLGGANAASAAYDPYRDRIVAFCGIGSQANPALNAIDAAGNATVVSTTYLVRLAPRGDGMIYGYKAGAILASPGHVRVRVTPQQATVDFVRSAVENAADRRGEVNASVVHSYTLAPRTDR